jgi:putative aldouronate transport system substrate-binding protein
LAAALLLALAAACGQAPASTAPGAAGADTSKEVHVRIHIYGDPPIDKTPLEALSAKMKEKINATFEVVPMGWESSGFDLLFASREAFDLVYVGASTYAASVKNGAFMPLDDLLPRYAPNSLANTPASAWEEAKVEGKIYAVPYRYTEYVPGGILYRGDLLKKYGMDEIASLEDLDAYFAQVIANGDALVPFAPDTGWAGWYLGEMFINVTKDWIPLDLVTGMMVVGESAETPEKFLYPPFAEEFVAFAQLMKAWDTKGYWSKDVLSSTANHYNEFLAGNAAACFQHALGYMANYGTVLESLPGSDPRYYCFSEAKQKVLKQPAMANATALSATSQNPERAMMALDLLLNDQEFNRLVRYGIKGKNYDLDPEGYHIRPAGYDESKDHFDIGVWGLNVDDFTLPSRLGYPDKAALMAKLDGISKPNPYAGFLFDSSDLANEVAAIGQVNSQIGTEILLGKVADPVAAVETYRDQLRAAGIDKLTEALTTQYKAFAGK